MAKSKKKRPVGMGLGKDHMQVLDRFRVWVELTAQTPPSWLMPALEAGAWTTRIADRVNSCCRRKLMKGEGAFVHATTLVEECPLYPCSWRVSIMIPTHVAYDRAVEMVLAMDGCGFRGKLQELLALSLECFSAVTRHGGVVGVETVNMAEVVAVNAEVSEVTAVA